jgi:hypothetical protein
MPEDEPPEDFGSLPEDEPEKPEAPATDLTDDDVPF